MPDLATLGLGVDSRPVDRAENSLGKFVGAAKRAENAAKGFGTGTRNAGRMAVAANDNVTRSANEISGAYRRAKQAAAAFITAAIVNGARDLFQFQNALAEVSTLVDTSTFKMEELADSAERLSVVFGSTPVAQTKAFYQIISAGASTAAEATDILTAANKLAIGGVTDVTTAADGLTSVLNAYGDQVESATAVSDAMFVAMRAGKTTIGEISGAIGQVAPLAAAAGVGFDELVASLAALTKGGISTNVATTGVRAIIAAIVKPTKEAADMAALLGIEFNTAALKAKGFREFIADLVAKTGGNTDALAKLFGGVEALTPALALAGQAGVDFNVIMTQMEVRAGETEVAFNKMVDSPGFQGAKVLAAFRVEMMRLVDSTGSALVPTMKVLADNMHEVVNVVGLIAAGLLIAFGGPVTALIVALATAFLVLTRNAGQTESAISGYLKVSEELRVLDGKLAASSGVRTTALEAERKQLLANAIAENSLLQVKLRARRESLIEELTPVFEPLSGGGLGNEIALGINSAIYSQELKEFNRIEEELKDLGLAAADIRLIFSTPIPAGMGSSIADDLFTIPSAAEDAKKGIDGISKSLEGAHAKANEFFAGVTKGFVSDMRNGLEQGKGFWNAFGDAALNVLDKITDKLLNEVIDALFKVNGASKGIGSGGSSFLGDILGNLFGGGSSSAVNPIAQYANGGAFQNGVQAFASGGIVNGPTLFPMANGMGLMGEAGPEAVMPLKRGSDGRLGVSVNDNRAGGNRQANDNRQAVLVQSEVVVRVDDEGALQAYVEKTSVGSAVQVVAASRESFIEDATANSGSALGRGDYDQSMAKFGATRQANAR